MDLEFWKMRVDSIREASSRARWVYAAATVASMAQIGATWNIMGSELRGFAFNVSDVSKNELLKTLQKTLLQQWVESMFVNVPLLGIRFSFADASIVGSLALMILAVWLLYNVRRENHLISLALSDSKGESSDVRTYVYHGILGSQVFAQVSVSDEAPRGCFADRTCSESIRDNS